MAQPNKNFCYQHLNQELEQASDKDDVTEHIRNKAEEVEHDDSEDNYKDDEDPDYFENLNDIADRLQSLPLVTPCSVCHRPAKVYCRQCSRSYCLTCDEILHKFVEILSTHNRDLLRGELSEVLV